ncbi:MAG: hypothetical protein JSV03_05975 [Planctomycetota bacterium]|nr:MAG: hypothetical protein JSV03_05975 [Planctomycetota bacterium]
MKSYLPIVFIRVFIILITLLSCQKHSLAVEALGDLTGPWRLFVDDYPVAVKTDVVRTYHPFQKYAGNPVLVADRPWEGSNIYVYGNVLPDESKTGYRMWYHCLPLQPAPGDYDKYRLLYATSEDGINWNKPNLGIVLWPPDGSGTGDNNIFIRRENDVGVSISHIPSVIHTPWEQDPQHHYLLINKDTVGIAGGGNIGGYWGARSADGIHWTDMPNNPLIDPGGDVGNFVWDPHSGQYLGYVKVNPDVSGLRRRAVGLTATSDLTTWPMPELVLAPDDFDDRWVVWGGTQRTHFYGLCAFAYESMYIGFLWIFRATDPAGYYDGPIFVELVSSQDGVHWLREEGDRPPILPLGPYGSWDDGMLFTTNHPLVEGEIIRLYYGGCDGYHAGPADSWNCSIGLATLRKDGFASLDAGSTIGTVTTKRLTGTGGPLHVNYDATGGWLKVEVLDEDGNVLPGYSESECDLLQGDSVDQVVTWGVQTELPAGTEPLRLQFVMQDASIYSFMAGDSVQVLDEPPGQILAVLYTFEKNASTIATDKLLDDGAQDLNFSGAVKVDANPANAAFGNWSVLFGPESSLLSTLEIEGTSNLGTQFTLAAMVNDIDNDYTRLFSSHDGYEAVTTSELVFDFDPSGIRISGLRLVCKGISIESGLLNFADDQYHHIAATYDDGVIKFYLDGTEVGGGQVPGGAPVLMNGNLLVGEDVNRGGDEQFWGNMDDILVLGRVLDQQEIMDLSLRGAGAFYGLVEIPADFDNDCDVDQEDFGRFQICLTGPSVPQTDLNCLPAMLDGDSDVDRDDFTVFHDCMSGPNVWADPNCIN